MFSKITIPIILILFLAVLACGFIAVKESRNLKGFRFSQVSPEETLVYYNNQDDFYIVQYVPKEQITPLFGEARNEFGNEIALVRNDLSENMRKFVMYHELYHLQDIKHKSKLSREISASLAAAPYSFIGFIETIFMTVVDFNRIKYYLNFNE